MIGHQNDFWRKIIFLFLLTTKLGEFCSDELEWTLFPLVGTSVQLEDGLFMTAVSDA